MHRMLQQSEPLQEQFVNGDVASELGCQAAMGKTCTNIFC